MEINKNRLKTVIALKIRSKLFISSSATRTTKEKRQYSLYYHFQHNTFFQLIIWAGSLNRDSTADATSAADANVDSTAAKKTWIFKSFSRIT